MMQPSVLWKQWDHLPGRSRHHRIAMVRGMCAFRRIGYAAGILSRRRYTRRRRSRDINTIMKANAGGFRSIDREKSSHTLFFVCGLPVDKHHNRDVTWTETAREFCTTTLDTPLKTQPNI